MPLKFVGEEYKVSLSMKNRPTMIPLWVPIGETVSLDTAASAPSSSNVVSDSDRASNSHADEPDMMISLPLLSSSISLSQNSSSQDNTTDSVATATPNPKRIRFGTRPDCMNLDTDASNAVTVEWARPNVTTSH